MIGTVHGPCNQNRNQTAGPQGGAVAFSRFSAAKRLPSQAPSRPSKCPAVCSAGWVWCLSRSAASQPQANVLIISAANAEAGSRLRVCG